MVDMEEAGTESYYIQDDLGSPMGIMDELGGLSDTYAFDEFGEGLYSDELDEHEKSLQPFGYTGYQMDEVSGLYFAQARRYDAGNGRFVSEDLHRGYKSLTYTLNKYSYCWNRPMNLVDENGKFPWVIIPIVVAVAVGLTSCSTETQNVSASETASAYEILEYEIDEAVDSYILKAYNGTRELAEKYRKVTIQYYEAFKKYNCSE